MIAESFERIHRSNLVGMGVLPLQYLEGTSTDNLGLTGTEYMYMYMYSISSLTGGEGGHETHYYNLCPD